MSPVTRWLVDFKCTVWNETMREDEDGRRGWARVCARRCESVRECAKVCEMVASGGKLRKFELAGRIWRNSGGNSATTSSQQH